MALNFSQRETSEGPLDVARPTSESNGPATFERTGEDEPLDPTVEPTNDQELEARKNPLGYTVTQPTEDEIDGKK